MVILAGATGHLWLESKRQAERARSATELAERQKQAAEQFIVGVAGIGVARVHEEQAVGILNKPEASRGTRDYQMALLHALEAQRQRVGGRPALRQSALDRLRTGALDRAFAQRWASPSPIFTSSGDQVLAFSPDGKMLAIASPDNRVRLWDPATAQTMRTLEGHGEVVHAVAFSPDGRLLASASTDETLRLWDPATGRALRTLGTPTNRRVQGMVTTVAFSPDGRLLASAQGDAFSYSHDYSVHLWDPATGQALRTLAGHRMCVTAVAFSPDGHTLASASRDNTVRLWDPATGESLGTLEGHRNDVMALAFSPDGRLLASAENVPIGSDASGEMRLWDLSAVPTFRTLEGRPEVPTVAFSPDGRLLAGAIEKTVRLSDPATGTSTRRSTSARNFRN